MSPTPFLRELLSNKEHLSFNSYEVDTKNDSYNLRGDYILSLPKPKSTTYGLN